MKISKLIRELKLFEKRHGDIDVNITVDNLTFDKFSFIINEKHSIELRANDYDVFFARLKEIRKETVE